MGVLKKILRFVFTGLLALLVILLIFVAFSVAPADRTPASDFAAYDETLERLEKQDTTIIPGARHGFVVGYAKVNLTPAQRTATAGYGNRRGKLFTAVHDSIFVRALVIDNGSRKVAIVSADLIIIPPTVTEQLQHKLTAIGFSLDNTYLGATHTHNSIGNWGEGAARFIYGAYQDSIVNFIADRIVLAVRQASQNGVSSQIRAGAVAVPTAVDNRLIDGGPEDSLLRVMEIHRSDSSKLLFTSYTAHATCLYSRDLELSRDYPGKLVDTLEAKGYDFAMFMAGAVGSHGCTPPEFGKPCIDWMANEIATTFLQHRDQLHAVRDTTVAMMRVPLSLSEPRVKVLPNWSVRTWLFRAAFGEYPVNLAALRVGHVLMLGTPCDFSGELTPPIDSAASRNNFFSLVTSFNGGYIGYATPSIRYDEKHYETQLMNWYAPGTGEYIAECLERLMTIMEK